MAGGRFDPGSLVPDSGSAKMVQPEEKSKVKYKVKSLFGVKKKPVAAENGVPKSEQAYLYKSEEQLRKTANPQLVLADAPKNPLYGRKLEDDAVYAITSGKGENVLPQGDGSAMTKAEIDALLAGAHNFLN